MRNYYARSDRLKDTILIDYLYGEDIKIPPPDERLVDFGERIPKLASPISAYLLEIWGFISAYSPVFRAKLESPAKDEWLDMQMEKSNLIGSLQDIWERLAITGEVCLVALPSDGLTYRIKQFEYSEFIPDYDELGKLVAVRVKSVSGDYSYRMEVTDKYYRVYEKVRLDFIGDVPYTDYPHSYGFVPAAIIYNNKSLASEGYSDFDETTIDLAIELIRQTAIPSLNFRYFGRPWIISPDPKETRKAIVKRDVVLQAEASEDGGNPTALSIPAVPDNLYEYLEILAKNFYQQMGLSYVRDATSFSAASSLALKIIYAQSIRTAEDKMKMITSGIVDLLQKLLRMAATDGILLDVFLNDYETYAIKCIPSGEPFPLSPQEKLAQLSIASQLRDIGIAAEVALQEFYRDKSSDEILELLEET